MAAAGLSIRTRGQTFDMFETDPDELDQHDPEEVEDLDVDELEDDPAYNPDDDDLKSIKGG